MKKYIILLAAVLGMSSCEEVIDIDLKDADAKLVIEGTISNQNNVPAMVKISKTVSFDASNAFNGVSGAVVTIADESGSVETLKSTSAGVYIAEKIKGQIGKKYTLTVLVEGKTYKAESTMPQNIDLTDVTFSKSEDGPNKGYFLAMPIFTDPEKVGDNYRFIQYKNNVIDKSYFIGNDNLRNGLPNVRPLLNPSFELAEGDDYRVEMQCIDRPTHDYFYTLLLIGGNGPGGGTTPTNPPSNISGGVLGYFSAYTSQTISKKVR
ncbi:MAG: DUF4249 family protein [Leadbetterella sp.]